MEGFEHRLDEYELESDDHDVDGNELLLCESLWLESKISVEDVAVVSIPLMLLSLPFC